MRKNLSNKFSLKKLPIVGSNHAATICGCDEIAFRQTVDFVELQRRGSDYFSSRFAPCGGAILERRIFEESVKRFCSFRASSEDGSYPHLIHQNCGQPAIQLSAFMKRLLRTATDPVSRSEGI
jgi:hypothetical protein